ncbi:MAG TPA: hypothetical protein VEI97_13475, partial [bacterium]|nr:hypothetical protein [bacterium]
LAGFVGLSALGCAGNPTTPTNSPAPALPQGQAALGEAIVDGDTVQMPLGLYTIRLDASGTTASIEPKEIRTLSAAGDDKYSLCVSDFFPSPPVRITRITITGSHLSMNYQVSHPFAAPTNLDAPASASNRADLGISGRCVFLADASLSGGLPTASSFFDGTVVCNPNLVSNAHGYCDPEDLLKLTDYTCNNFPYRCLVDELDPTCRTATKDGSLISSTGDIGNYNAAAGGWQRSNISNNLCGWTGYGVLHQGQTASSVVDLDLDGLDAYQSASGGFAMDMAILADYNDPRGGSTPTEKKRNRLPSSDGNTDSFFYNMPAGTRPIERCDFPDQTWDTLSPVDPGTCAVSCVAWDGDASALSVSLSCPEIFGPSPVTLTTAPSGSGLPSSAFSWSEPIASRIDPASVSGTYLACMQVTTTNTDGWTGLDCDLAPVSSAAQGKHTKTGHVTLLK